MRRFFLAALLLALLVGGIFLLQKYDIEGLGAVKLRPKTGTGSETAGSPAPPAAAGATIRIATFNIQMLGESKLAKPKVVHVLAQILRRFDVVAIQEVRAESQDIIPRLVDHVNADGARYDYVIGPRLGRSSSKEQYAYVFNQASLEADRDAIYTVEDTDDRLHREPLVAAFRARGPPAERAFTFTLVNIHVDPDETETELAALDDVLRAVQADGRGEDDIILLGDLNVDDRHLGELGMMPGIGWAISGIATNTRGTRTYDNIVYHAFATSERTGRAGVLDVMREFNLTMQETLSISDHLPVWIETSVYEGGEAGRIATRPRRPLP